ncbi:hypothetical protein B0I21_102198 [Sphingobacterium paludis]|uniref:Uncharacterized protein n=1 Tax=Sphingobacterium paludis TaxID=1476465 RepID=A0A4R7D6Q3_9SPHI|nr:hypothetical protein B0I21_102198 [Sphingobacterium paludis]
MVYRLSIISFVGGDTEALEEEMRASSPIKKEV